MSGRGLVALGDSITRGSGDSMLGLRMQSWALWLAEALELPYTCLARDGARSGDGVAEQLPRLRGPYELGCIYLGVNDVRTPGFDLGAFRANIERVADATAEQCGRMLLLGLPAEIGRPPAPVGAIAAANAVIAEVAAAHDALLLSLQTLRGSQLVQPDAVHLTARGEAHIALLACRLLAAEGLQPREQELIRALEPLGARSRARHLIIERTVPLTRDLRRRLREGIELRLGERA